MAQVSLKGLQFLKTLPNNLFEEVNAYIYAPNAPHYDTELLEVLMCVCVCVCVFRYVFGMCVSVCVYVFVCARACACVCV